MEPKDFQNVGKALLNFEAKSNYALTLNYEGSSVCLKLKNDFTQPVLGTKFQTPIGAFRITKEADKPAPVVEFSPKLEQYHASLNANLLNGEFNFKADQLFNLPLGIEIDNNNKHLLKCSPQFKFAGFKVAVNSAFDGKNVCATIKADASRLGIRSCICQKEQKARFGLFSFVGPVNFGASGAFDYTNKSISEVRVYSMIKKCVCTTAAIFTVIPEKKLEILTECGCPKHCIKHAASFNYGFSDKSYGAQFATSCSFKCGSTLQVATDNKLGLKLAYDTKFRGTGIKFTGSTDSLLKGKEAKFDYGVWFQINPAN